jgi:argininosuccinate synthase
VAVNGERLGLVEVFERCNRVAGRHGVGIGTHVVENRFVGVKSRGIYEAPGMELIGRTYEFLLQFILDRRARDLLERLSSFISTQIYQGYWYDLGTTAALAALEPISRLATGAITVRLYKGEIFFDSAEDTPEAMPHSLYTDDSSMEAMGTYDHADAEGFLKVLGISAKNVGERQFGRFGR